MKTSDNKDQRGFQMMERDKAKVASRFVFTISCTSNVPFGECTSESISLLFQSVVIAYACAAVPQHFNQFQRIQNDSSVNNVMERI